jgi:hypothetical protein
VVIVLLFLSVAFVISQEIIKMYLKQSEAHGSDSETDDDFQRVEDVNSDLVRA